MKQKITLTIDQTLLEAIRKVAKQQNRSISNEFEHALKPKYLPVSDLEA